MAGLGVYSWIASCLLSQAAMSLKIDKGREKGINEDDAQNLKIFLILAN